MKSSKNIPDNILSNSIVTKYPQTPQNAMDAIAHGVQARLDASIQFSQRVTEETIRTARAIGVSNTVIEKWASRRVDQAAQKTEKLRRLIALLEN